MVSFMLYPCSLCVALLVLCVACLTVFMNCLMKNSQCVWVWFLFLSLNVMDVFRVGGGILLGRPCMVLQRMCVLCM